MPRHLAAMATATTLEMLRDRKTLFFSVLYPFGLLAVFLGAAAVLPPSQEIDRVPFFLATGLFVALGSMAFFGVTVPLIALRERGTLRLLSTTPVSRLTVLLAHAPARLMLALGQVAVIGLVSAALGHLPARRIGALLLTSLAALCLLVPLGFLLAAFLPTAEAATNTLTVALLALLGLSGLFMPLDRLPDRAGEVLSRLPPGLLGAAIRQDLTGHPAAYPAWLAWLACAATGIVLTAIAARTFRWSDDG